MNSSTAAMTRPPTGGGYSGANDMSLNGLSAAQNQVSYLHRVSKGDS